MKVLVLGGTGAMGVHFVQLLALNKIETVITTRSRRESTEWIKYIRGNAHDLSFLQPLLAEKWDAIVDFMVYSTDTFKKRHHLFLDSTKQYVFLSSSRVYADSQNPLTEDSPRLLDVSKDKDYLASDEYALTKARQEDLLINSGCKNWTIIRPYITYSENRLQLGVLEKEEWLFRAIQGKTIVFSSDIITHLTTMTYGLDVAKGLFSVIGNKNAFGECFHITNQKSVYWSDIVELYLLVLTKYLGCRPKVLLINLNTFLMYKTSEYQVKYDRLYDRVFDNTTINEFINVKAFTAVEDGLTKSLEAFLKDPKFGMINWRIEAMKDRLTKEHTSLNAIPGFKQKIKYVLFRYFFYPSK